MKLIRTAIIAGTLLGAGVAHAQVNMPDPGLPGSSPANAVRVVAPSEIMADRYINRWIRTHYPGWNADPIEFTEIGFERYAVVRITSANNPSRRVYFRIQGRQNDPTDDGAPFPM
jgi:hypothetical protein